MQKVSERRQEFAINKWRPYAAAARPKLDVYIGYCTCR